MGQGLILVIVIAVAAVAFFALIMSVVMVRGGERNPQTEVGTNSHMRERGINCAADDARRENRARQGADCSEAIGCGGICSTCGPEDKK